MEFLEKFSQILEKVLSFEDFFLLNSFLQKKSKNNCQKKTPKISFLKNGLFKVFGHF